MKKILSVLVCCLMLLGLASNVVKAEDYVCQLGSNGEKYTTIEAAIEAATDDDTIHILVPGSYTVYKGIGGGSVTNKSLTIIGTGESSTTWYIGALVPREGYVGEYDGDYSFDGAKNITLKNMTINLGSKPYLGYIRVRNFTCENCTINGQITYGGMDTATYKNCTFNAPGNDYVMFSIDGHELTFEGCTFNAAGKVINAYKHYYEDNEKYTVTINYKDCKVVSTAPKKSVINIKDTDGNPNTDTNFIVNISGTNTVEGLESNKITCSKLFQVANENGEGEYYSTVYIDGTKVWEKTMLNHNVDCTNDKYTDGYKYDDFTYQYGEWKEQEDGSSVRNVSRVCNICGYAERYTETKKNEVEVPATGDAVNLALMATAMFASATAATSLIVKKKKHSK